ncbi:MAG: ornithine aminomutase subunit alpha [Clostridia bacterium]|nr:ornithine aminomutase subunit alpha [Clostridia bacterium]
MKRNDDYNERSAHLKNLTDEELKERFWALTEQLIDPLLKLGYENTSPAIERSVLLRMGFSSLEAKDIVSGCLEHDLLGHGAGNVVYRYAKSLALPVQEAGRRLLANADWAAAKNLFKGVEE